jgi:hypothetical protein
MTLGIMRTIQEIGREYFLKHKVNRTVQQGGSQITGLELRNYASVRCNLERPKES